MVSAEEDSFGARLRAYRLRLGMQIGVLALRLDVSTQYLDDVERGRRRALAPRRIAEVGRILELNLAELEYLYLRRGLEFGAFELPCSSPEDPHAEQRNRTAARLQAAWDTLTQEQLEELRTVLRGLPATEQGT